MSSCDYVQLEKKEKYERVTSVKLCPHRISFTIFYIDAIIYLKS